MPRLRTPLLYLAIALTTTPSLAQTPPTRLVPDVAIPATLAGTALRAWLDAFNSGDSTRMAAYTRTFESTLAPGRAFVFRQQPGRRFDLLSIERNEPRHIEFVLLESPSQMISYGAIDMVADAPIRVESRVAVPLGPNASIAELRIDATQRARVIARAAALLDSFYVFPDVAKRVGDSARIRLARGSYDGYETGPGFAIRLNRDFGEIARDKHLGVQFSARPLPPQRAESAAPMTPSAEEIARARSQMDQMNCGFRKAEQLDGNVGYLKFDLFADTELCGATASAAMNFLAGTRALVIDLRENGGGSPGMVRLVASYLFDRRTHLNDLWTRSTGKTEEFWTQDSVPGRRFGGEKPVYVLTSGGTFSGGEEFAYDLKSLGRATIVGETTGGGAHPVRGKRIDEHFMIGVPFARAINPVTHTNWEGVGVEPDVKVPASDALATALKLIGETKRRYE